MQNLFCVVFYAKLYCRFLMSDNSSPGGGQEIQRLWYPQRDDGGLEVPEQRLQSGRVHQHLPQRQGDRDSLRRRSQAAGQISWSAPTSFIAHPVTFSFMRPSYSIPSADPPLDWWAHPRERGEKNQLWTSFPSHLELIAMLEFSNVVLFPDFYEGLFSRFTIVPSLNTSVLFAVKYLKDVKQQDMASAYRWWRPPQKHLDKWPLNWSSLQSRG